MKRKSFFTIVELLVVMAIIGIIMAVLLPALSKARAVGKRTACLSQLRQVGTAMMLYRIDNNLNWVPWSSLLFPNYVSSNKVYQCPSDLNPSETVPSAWKARIDNVFHEAYDRPNTNLTSTENVGLYGSRHYDAAENISYLYEMSEKQTDIEFWATPDDKKNDNPMSQAQRISDGIPKKAETTWAIYKEIQLNRGGDGNLPLGTSYSVSVFPIYRCYWHVRNIKKYSESNTLNDIDPPVINITYSGNYVLSKLTWELGIWSP